jgi:hypothetical protein
MFSLSVLTYPVLYVITTTSLPSWVSFYVIVYWFVRGIVEKLFNVFIFTQTNDCDCIHFVPVALSHPTNQCYV